MRFLYRMDSDPSLNLGACAAEEIRHYISMLSAVSPQHIVGIMAKKRSVAQTP